MGNVEQSPESNEMPEVPEDKKWSGVWQHLCPWPCDGL